MRFLGRLLFWLLALALVAGGVVYYLAGRLAGPSIVIAQPGAMVGLASTLDLTIEAPRGALSRVQAVLHQGERQFPLFSLDQSASATVAQESEDRIRITRPIGKQSLPELQPGPARLVITAARPVVYGIREIETTVARDLQLRFTPPRLTVASTHHFINHGGSEMVVYRVTPSDVESGVRMGEVTYPGFPASGAGVAGADPTLKVSFFALLFEQDLNTRPELYGRDAAMNQARTPIDHRIFPKLFRRSRIEVTDEFLQRVIPDIVERSPELAGVDVSQPDRLLPAFLRINGELRRLNAEKIASFAAKTAPEILWQGPFLQMSNSQVESGFADHRTYVYQGREIDQQVHLGFDLAATAAVAVHAANRGRVLHADYLGIYGNCIIIDHGMGIQSLYAHLSSFDVKPGDIVEKNQVIGRSGMTGLAGGDHLHFTMLVNGRPVNPVEWWDPHWIEDRVTRKLAAPSGP